MMELNQNVILIAVAVIGILVFYYLHREVKRTQLDVQGLKVFSENVANYIEPSTLPDNMPGVCSAPTAPTPSAPSAQPVPPPTAAPTEEKKDK